MRITVFDYEAGNLHSLLKALDVPSLGVSLRVETDARALVRDTALLVLPGVGAFGHAAARLAPGRDEVAAALRDGLPAIGICLGMQLLAEASDEGEGAGLGLVPGRVRKLRARRVPQIGWNAVEWSPVVGLGEERADVGPGEPPGIVIPSEPRSGESRDPRAARSSLDSGLRPSLGMTLPAPSLGMTGSLPIAYYANSYVCAVAPDDPCVLATSTHEADRFACVVRVARTTGVQFHPEKSSTAGVSFLRALIAQAATGEVTA